MLFLQIYEYFKKSVKKRKSFFGCNLWHWRCLIKTTNTLILDRLESGSFMVKFISSANDGDNENEKEGGERIFLCWIKNFFI